MGSLSSVEHLVRLGLSTNEAKALSALIALGPTGASDVYKEAGMPRNKTYEALGRLVNRGMVEVQNGYPIMYRAIGARAIVDGLTESYGTEARAALSLLQQEENLSRDIVGKDEPGTYAWMVKGEAGVKRRLAELIYNAKTDIFCVSGFPPKYLLSSKTSLKAAARRGLRTRPVSMIRPTDDYTGLSLDDRAVIEFRTVKRSRSLNIQPLDEKLISAFASMSGYGAMVIVDDSLAFDIVDDGADPSKATGILLKASGVPRVQKATVERILALYTRKI
jgi:HTH-type transcriptional regulator, sugar sensing transcriptional regulator